MNHKITNSNNQINSKDTQNTENDNGKIQYLENLIKDFDDRIEVLKGELMQKNEELNNFKNNNSELSNDINDLTDENQALKDVISYMAIEKYKC